MRINGTFLTGAAAFVGVSNIALWVTDKDYFGDVAEYNPLMHLETCGLRVIRSQICYSSLEYEQTICRTDTGSHHARASPRSVGIVVSIGTMDAHLSFRGLLRHIGTPG
jgi:hypothetical protein